MYVTVIELMGIIILFFFFYKNIHTIYTIKHNKYMLDVITNKHYEM